MFGLGPLLGEENDDDEDSNGEHSSETVVEEQSVAAPDPTTTHLVVGDLVGTDNYLLQVHCVPSQQTHVVVVTMIASNLTGEMHIV